jgi:hypothetical protein
MCDWVGTHIGFVVLETAVELGLEIVLRVPYLSFCLQGEDTVTFCVEGKVITSPEYCSDCFSLL